MGDQRPEDLHPLASYADYIWLAARTDPDAPKHQGITIFAVPTTDPGFSYSKIYTMVNASTFNTFYDDVRVGDDAIIGELHHGLEPDHQPAQLRAGVARPSRHDRAAPTTTSSRGRSAPSSPTGARVIDQEWVQINLARVHAKLEFVKLINWKVARQPGRRQPGRRQRHQGLRHRVLHRGLPAADGDRRPDRPHSSRDVAGSRAQRPPRPRPSRAC